MTQKFFPTLMLAASMAALSPVPALARENVTITRFHNAPALQGQVLKLQPVDPALAQSLEFTSYANLIGDELGRLGMVPEAADKPATVIAYIAYGQSERTEPERRSSPISVGVGVGTGGWGHTGISIGGSMGLGGSKARTPAVVTSLVVTLKRPDGTALWEGRAETDALRGKSAALPTLMPRLVRALFADFPGASGKAVTARLAPLPKTPASK